MVEKNEIRLLKRWLDVYWGLVITKYQDYY